MVLADDVAEDFYREALGCLIGSRVPFLLGGAYALAHYTGIVRRTKDLDVFIRPADCGRVLDAFARAGFRTELTDPNWIAKAFHASHFVDIIFSSGNSIATVDDGWFSHATRVRALGWDVCIAPVEEMIWSKAFVMERERFDGADVLHLILRCGSRMDWRRLLERMEPHWEVLLAHLTLFQYAYPSHREIVPAWLLDVLEGRLQAVRAAGNVPGKLCRGPLISRAQYRIDVEDWGFAALPRPDVGVVLTPHPPEELEHGDEAEEGPHGRRRRFALSRRQRRTPA
jgi:hypothetical protein